MRQGLRAHVTFRLHSRSGRGGRRRLSLGAAIAASLVAVAPAQAAPFAYVANQAGNSVSQYGVGAGGLLAPLGPPTVDAGESPRSVAVSPDGKSVYVTNLGSEFDDIAASVSQYDVGANGALSAKSPASVLTDCEAVQVAVSPDGKSAYLAGGPDCGRVFQYDVGAGGALSPKSPAFVVDDFSPLAVVVSPDSQSVYVANNDGGVSQYDVGAGGTLSPKSPAKVAAGASPRGVAVSPNGESVYVTNWGGNSVSQYDVGSDGALSPKSSAKVAAGTNPRGVAVSPNGKSVYVANEDADNVSQYDINPVSGALSPKTPPTVAAGRLPVAVAVSPTVQAPTSQKQCKRRGWRQFGFKNQGQCIRFVKHGSKK